MRLNKIKGLAMACSVLLVVGKKLQSRNNCTRQQDVITINIIPSYWRAYEIAIHKTGSKCKSSCNRCFKCNIEPTSSRNICMHFPNLYCEAYAKACNKEHSIKDCTDQKL